MKENSRIDHCDLSRLGALQETIKQLPSSERAALREWLNGYEGSVLIFLNPPDSSDQRWERPAAPGPLI